MASSSLDKDGVARQLAAAFVILSSSENKTSFASLCDRWIQQRRQNIVHEQAWIDAISEAYSEFLNFGEEKFIQKYASVDTKLLYQTEKASNI